MSQQVVQINVDFPAPVTTVFAFFGDHEKMSMILGAKVKRIKDGEDSPNGKGSVRRFYLLLPIEETVTAYKENELIEYTISNNMPLKNHKGTMKFSEQGGITSLDYNIVFESKIPLTGGFIRKALELVILRGCKKYAASLR
jgi:uncharacterized protein YndB with AHSA1/START domain